jgi:spore coat protein CotH
MGVATPEHAYVNFYVNGELFGFYLMVEAIDGGFLENNFANSNGDLYKPDGIGSDLLWINDDITSYSDVNLQTNEETSDNGAFINFVDMMDEGSTDVIDVDGLLRYMSVSVALSNLDSYHGSLAHNYYLYEQDGVFSLLPWDFNEAFGSFSMGCKGVDVRELYIDEPIIGPVSDRPMVANVFSSQENLAIYHDYLWQLIEGPLSSDEFNARVASIADLISEHVANDPSGFYSYNNFESNLNTSVDRFYGLTEFIDYRVNNMTQQLQGDLPTAGDGSGFCSGNAGGPPP